MLPSGLLSGRGLGPTTFLVHLWPPARPSWASEPGPRALPCAAHSAHGPCWGRCQRRCRKRGPTWCPMHIAVHVRRGRVPPSGGSGSRVPSTLSVRGSRAGLPQRVGSTRKPRSELPALKECFRAQPWGPAMRSPASLSGKPDRQRPEPEEVLAVRTPPWGAQGPVSLSGGLCAGRSSQRARAALWPGGRAPPGILASVPGSRSLAGDTRLWACPHMC